MKAQKPEKMASKITKQIFQNFGTKLDSNSGNHNIIQSTNNDKKEVKNVVAHWPGGVET